MGPALRRKSWRGSRLGATSQESVVFCLSPTSTMARVEQFAVGEWGGDRGGGRTFPSLESLLVFGGMCLTFFECP